MSDASQPFQLDELTIQVAQEGDTLTLSWSGISEIQNPEQGLGPYLQRIVKGLTAQKVAVDFRQLEYMNSATLQPILQMIRELNERQIPTKLLFDQSMESQRITYRCLQNITKPLRFIDTSAN